MRDVAARARIPQLTFGQRAQPQNGLWVCFDPSHIPSVYIEGHDASDTAHGRSCFPVPEVVSAGKAGYWLYRAFKWLREVEPPSIP